MESATKLKLGQDQLSEIIFNAFGSDAQILNFEENNDGWFNSLYCLEIKGIADVFLKIAPLDNVPTLRYEKNIIQTEIEVLKLFEQNPAIPCPKILFEDKSRNIISSDYFIMEKLKGSSLGKIRENLSDEKKKLINREKGRINRVINDIKGQSFGIFSADRKKYPTWKEAFLHLVDDILTDAEEFEAPLAVPIIEIRDMFKAHSKCLDSVIEPSLIHWDLHDGNILVNDGIITGIIDCDRALWGDPAMEFFFTGLFPEPQDFFEGYQKKLSDDKDFEQKRNLYDLYLTIIFVTECCSRNITDENHLKWADGMFRKQWEKTLGIISPSAYV